MRLATHANFKEFVLTAGLEFYPLGGDPKILAECMFFKSIFQVFLRYLKINVFDMFII